jgi:branched-chain amino acid transport system ATP-binding protein
VFEFKNLSAKYGSLEVIKDLSLKIERHEMVAILGHNGAGKTTLLKCAVGEHKKVEGIVELDGRAIIPGAVNKNVMLGIGFVPQEDNVFRELEVEENLRVAGLMFGASKIKQVYQLFPKLEERKRQHAGTLSGGERQMLAVGMGLMASPSILFLDEPTPGLAPLLVENVLSTLRRIHEEMSISIVIVEQNVKAVLEVVHRVVILKMGRMVFNGKKEEIHGYENLWALF